MPQEFEQLYFQTNGFGAQINDLFVEFWNIDQIISFNEIYEEVICGECCDVNYYDGSKGNDVLEITAWIDKRN